MYVLVNFVHVFNWTPNLKKCVHFVVAKDARCIVCLIPCFIWEQYIIKGFIEKNNKNIDISLRVN